MENIVVTLYANYFHRHGLTPESLHLMDMSCVGTVEETDLVFNFSATECSTTMVCDSYMEFHSSPLRIDVHQ